MSFFNDYFNWNIDKKPIDNTNEKKEIELSLSNEQQLKKKYLEQEKEKEKELENIRIFQEQLKLLRDEGVLIDEDIYPKKLTNKTKKQIKKVIIITTIIALLMFTIYFYYNYTNLPLESSLSCELQKGCYYSQYNIYFQKITDENFSKNDILKLYSNIENTNIPLCNIVYLKNNKELKVSQGIYNKIFDYKYGNNYNAKKIEYREIHFFDKNKKIYVLDFLGEYFTTLFVIIFSIIFIGFICCIFYLMYDDNKYYIRSRLKRYSKMLKRKNH